jgi:hypothetical protein
MRRPDVLLVGRQIDPFSGIALLTEFFSSMFSSASFSNQ